MGIGVGHCVGPVNPKPWVYGIFACVRACLRVRVPCVRVRRERVQLLDRCGQHAVLRVLVC